MTTRTTQSSSKSLNYLVMEFLAHSEGVAIIRKTSWAKIGRHGAILLSAAWLTPFERSESFRSLQRLRGQRTARRHLHGPYLGLLGIQKELDLVLSVCGAYCIEPVSCQTHRRVP